MAAENMLVLRVFLKQARKNKSFAKVLRIPFFLGSLHQ